jgi:NAD(P)-dependent dehydrogenase (short-subunit alcohol dehydrogenase family)
MAQLDGQAALVTGAAQGIGTGIARRLAGAGADVLITDLNPAGQEVADAIAADFGVKAAFRVVDVRNKDEVYDMVAGATQELGRLDVLVNNAWGGGGFGPLEDKTDAIMQAGLDVALWASHWGMQAAFPIFQEQGRGRIVTLASLNGVNAHPYTAEYNVAKEAVRALTRTAAREWATHGITANIVCPAAITPAYEGFRSAAPENAADLLKQNPMGRMGDPEADIGGVVVFLASDDAQYLTGNTLFVDGGSHLNGVSWDPLA